MTSLSAVHLLMLLHVVHLLDRNGEAIIEAQNPVTVAVGMCTDRLMKCVNDIAARYASVATNNDSVHGS